MFKDEVYAIIGAAIEIHKELGCGFLESVYQEVMEMELRDRAVPFEAQRALTLVYKGRELKKYFVADFICYGQIVVEIKSMDKLTAREEAQLLNYLRATGFRLGLVINFGCMGTLEWKRMIR